MPETRRFATFALDGLSFGVEVLQVQEVIRHQDLTRVPLAPDVVGGLINLRGQIVTAIDVRRRLELRERRAGRPPMHVVVRTEEGPVSLLVDDIGDVLEVTEECVERPPETLRGALRELVHAVCKLDGRLLLILDVHRTVRVGEAGDDPRRRAA